MIRKIVLMAAALAVMIGPARTADLPVEVLVATALEPPAAVATSPLPTPGLMDPRSEEPFIIARPTTSVARPLPGFKVSNDPGKTFFDLNLLAMVGLNVADYVTTRQALRYPGLHDVNPLMQPFVKSPAAFAAVKAGTTVLAYLGLKTLYKKNRTAAWVLTTATNVFLSYAVTSNLQKISQARTM